MYTNDGFPDECPCELEIQVMEDRLNQLKVKYKCIKIGKELELTMLKLKGAIKNFEVSELNKASQMEIFCHGINDSGHVYLLS